mgnify:FL=1|jgi:hypothetical protein
MIEKLKTEVEKLWADHSHCVISAAIGFVLGAIIF